MAGVASFNNKYLEVGNFNSPEALLMTSFWAQTGLPNGPGLTARQENRVDMPSCGWGFDGPSPISMTGPHV